MSTSGRPRQTPGRDRIFQTSEAATTNDNKRRRGEGLNSERSGVRTLTVPIRYHVLCLALVFVENLLSPLSENVSGA